MSERPNITEFRAFREHFREACGLYFADDKYSRVARVIGSRMSELGVSCFSEYQHMLTSSPRGTGEQATLATLLTVGETYFFRNEGHWRAFRECVLPWIVERKVASGRRRLRIWSAGCSTGEEAYTVAIVLSRSLPDLACWSIEIIGTDLNSAAITSARRAIYTQNSFRGVPPEIMERFFEPVEAGCHTPRPEIRDMVSFQEMNLLDTAATARMRDIDVILCRNVLIYFDASGIARVMTHFHHSLRSDGYLFLGHAEGMHIEASGFASMNVCDTFIYQSVSSARGVAGPTLTSPPLDHEPGALPAPTASDPDRGPSPEPGRKIAGETDKSRAVDRSRAGSSLGAIMEAERTLQRKAPTSPTPRATPEVESTDDLRARAIGHLCAEQNSDARMALEEILRREPGDSDGLLGMALILAGEGRSEAAMGCCERVLRAQAMSPEAHCVMALVREGRGEDDMAQRELEKAIYLDDGFSVAHIRLATLHHRANRQDAATREFHNALGALPGDDEQRVRLYSGGFSKQAVAQICKQRLGIESTAVQCESSWGSEGQSK